MTMHDAYWGGIEQDWKGFSSGISFSNPFFDKQDVEIFLGEEYDEDGEEIEEPPTESQLTEFGQTYQEFLENMDAHLETIQEEGFKRYRALYAHYYENPAKSGAPALQVANANRHGSYLKEIMYLRVLGEKTIVLTIRYKLDTEHGIEFKFVDGKLTDVGGISET